MATAISDPILRLVLEEALPKYFGSVQHYSSLAAAERDLPPGEALLLADDAAAASARAGLVILDVADAGQGPEGWRLGRLIDHVMRLRQPELPASLSFGPYRLAVADALLELGDHIVRLTEKERDLLVRLHAAGGQTVERGVLLAGLWGYAETVETHTLETHVYRLRQKIEDDPARPRWLLTQGAGYRLLADEPQDGP